MIKQELHGAGLVWKQYRKSNYEISNQGDVRNLTSGKIVWFRQTHYKGHIKVTLTIYGKRKGLFVHRLIALCHIKRKLNPKTGKYYNLVNHRDTIKWHNWWFNLEWTDVAGNTKHAVDNGLIDMDYVRSCRKKKAA